MAWKKAKVHGSANGTMIQYSTIKARLYPTEAQAKLFENTFGCCRYIWNRMLADQQRFYIETDAHFIPTPAKYKKEAPFLKEVDNQALIQEHNKLSQAFRVFFKDPGHFGYPNFKKKKTDRDSFTACNHEFESGPTIYITKDGIRMTKAGIVRAVFPRRPRNGWKLKRVTVAKTRSGKYYCYILYEYRVKEPVNANLKMSIFAETECHFSAVSVEVYTALIHNLTCRLEPRQALIYQLVLGLTGENGKYNYSRAVHLYPPFFDITCSAKNYKIAPALTEPEPLVPTPETTLGLKYSMPHFYVTDDGCKADPPHWLKQSQEKLTRIQKRLNRMQPGSKNYQEAVQKYRELHEHIANQRRDFIHKESSRIANDWDAVCMRGDSVTVISQRTKRGNALEAGFGTFREYLRYKLARQGKQLIVIDRYYPSTRTCSVCGLVLDDEVHYKRRTWQCPKCGTAHNREVNAAKNIKAQGLAQYFNSQELRKSA